MSPVLLSRSSSILAKHRSSPVFQRPGRIFEIPIHWRSTLRPTRWRSQIVNGVPPLSTSSGQASGLRLLYSRPSCLCLGSHRLCPSIQALHTTAQNLGARNSRPLFKARSFSLYFTITKHRHRRGRPGNVALDDSGPTFGQNTKDCSARHCWFRFSVSCALGTSLLAYHHQTDGHKSIVFLNISRLVSTATFADNTIDLTWVQRSTSIWTSVEPALAIVCADLPHLKPVLDRLGAYYKPVPPSELGNMVAQGDAGLDSHGVTTSCNASQTLNTHFANKSQLVLEREITS